MDFTAPRLRAIAIAAILLAWSPARTMAQDPESITAMQRSMQAFKSEVQAGKHAAAAKTAATLIPLAEKLMGENNPDIIRMRVQRAVLLRTAGDYVEARKQAVDAIRTSQSRLGRQTAVTATAINVLGTIDRLEGKYESASDNYQQAIQILERLGDESMSDKSEAYSNYADLLSETGDFAKAKQYAEISLELTRRKFGEKSERTAVAINNLGQILLALGDRDAAEKMLTDALAMTESLFGSQHFETATSRNNLGKLYVVRGKYDAARQQYESALKVLRSTVGDDHPVTVTTAGNLGHLYSEIGDAERAEPLLTESLARKVKLYGENHTAVALARHNLGGLMLDTSRFDQARELLTAAAESFESFDDSRLSDAAGSRAFLGLVEGAAGNTAIAIEQMESSRRLANSAVLRVLAQLSNNDQQKLMTTTYQWTLFMALSLADEFPNDLAVREATAVWLANGKGIATDAFVNAKRGNQDNAVLWTTIDELRAAMDDQSVWIDIVRQDVIKFHAAQYSERLGDPHYVAWILPKTGDIQRIDLGDANAIDALVDRFRSLIGKSGGAGGEVASVGEIAATETIESVLAEVAKAVWQPIQMRLADDVKRLRISPDGALWLLPWAALPTDESEKIVQRYATTLFTSGRELVAPQAQSPASVTPATIFSNPAFDQPIAEKRAAYKAVFRTAPPTQSDQRSLAIDRVTLRATPLPGTAIESAAIMPSLQRWFSRTPIQYRGRYALESVAKQMVSPPVVVFATHGFFVDDESKSVDPLQRCGLLLSGCNDARSSIAGDDGVLTGTEITEIDLRGTELVVLSACETGVGRIEDGNGVAGLGRSFRIAGARSVAATLWQIPDFDTAKLMSDFFAEVATGTAKDEALRRAQLKRIESRQSRNGAAHPYFWSGFTISGQ
ncbi:MAG: CHAT domain-containing tetratricopeptide repeat protein [Rubripirellula sp.]